MGDGPNADTEARYEPFSMNGTFVGGFLDQELSPTYHGKSEEFMRGWLTRATGGGLNVIVTELNGEMHAPNEEFKLVDPGKRMMLVTGPGADAFYTQFRTASKDFLAGLK